MSEKFEEKYAQARTEFDKLLVYATNLSFETTGLPATSTRIEDASLIFTKIVGHTISVARLLPTGLVPKTPGMSEFWDLSSICALIRALIDAYYALAYISIDEISEDEREFRRLLWTMHAESRRHHMLQLIGSTSPDGKVLAEKVSKLKTQIEAHPFIKTLDKEVRKKIQRVECSSHLTHKQLNERFRIDHNYYQAVYVFLSCYVHSFPFSLTQLTDFKAGTGDSLHLISVAVKYCTGFLALAIKGFISVVDCQITPVPDDVKTIIDKWAYVISKGVSDSA